MDMVREDAVRTLVKGGGIVLLATFVDSGISFLGKVIMARWLGASIYGEVVLGLTLVSTLGFLGILGIKTGLSRNIAIYLNERTKLRGLISAGFQITTVAGGIVSGILFVFADQIALHVFNQPDAAPVIRILSPLILLRAVKDTALGATKGLQYSRYDTIINRICEPTLRVSFVIIALYLGLSAIGVAWAYVLANIILVVLSIYIIYRITPFVRGQSETMRYELLIFSVPLIVSYGSSKVQQYADTLLIAFYHSSTDLAVYDIAYTMALLVSTGYSALLFMFTPAASERLGNDDPQSVGELYRFGHKWGLVFTLSVALVFILYSRQVLVGFYGTEYAGGSEVFILLTITFLVAPMLGPTGKMLTIFGHTKILGMKNAFAGILNVVLNIVLIQQYGIIGAAIATFITIALSNLTGLILIRWLTDIRLYNFRTFIASALVIILTISASEAMPEGVLRGIPELIVFGIGIIVAYVVVLIVVGDFHDLDLVVLRSIRQKYGVPIGPLISVIEWFKKWN